MSDDAIVIIGAGQGGFQLSCSLREAKFTGSIHLVGDEPHMPYQRPPLSKAYLSGEACLDQVLLRGKSFFDSRSIDLHLGERVIDVDRVGRAVTLASGGTLRYQHLGTGAKFNPHVTIGVATQSYLDDMLTEPFDTFTFSPGGAAIYQVGTFGTAAKQLKDIQFSP